MMVAAWRGRPVEARALIERVAREAVGSGHGRSFGLTRYALALLENSLGRYDHALAAAEEAVEDDGLVVASFSLPELIEGAVRGRHRHVAVDALDRLAERAIASGTNWAMGTLARSRALLAQGDDAEQLYLEAIERLGASRARPQLARAHLLYGEWLRRRRRRRDAREHLRRSESMFVTLGADAFAARARSELRATGETQAARGPRGSERLTAQETRIANLVADGASNPEIGALMFISPRTVEYHLHKIFQKLGVSSRGEIARRLPTDGLDQAERAPYG
jgi:DNA-binding CsgD family transcriptional regulator